MSKMTDDELRDALEDMETEGYASMAGRFRAHIAALTAERDGAVRNYDAEVAARVAAEAQRNMADRERDTLRERVKALEAEEAALPASLLDERGEWLRANNLTPEKVRHGRFPLGMVRLLMEQIQAAESHLTAIRQRAGDTQELENVAIRVGNSANWGRKHVALAVARHIVGDDASAPSEPLHCCGTTTEIHRASCPTVQTLKPLGMAPPSEMDGLHGEMVDAAWEGPPEDRRPSQEEQADATGPEPTTAEAFAEVAECLSPSFPGARALLSLLERRIGAQERAIKAFCVEHDNAFPLEATELRLALTDAPPVFTLEEVERCMAPVTAANKEGEALVASVKRTILANLRAFADVR